MSLKVFEQRYLDMAAECMREKTPFGVCLIEHGQEVGTPAVPHAIGTLAQIDQGDVPQLGILMLAVTERSAFGIIERHAQADGLLRARIELLDEINAQPIPEALRTLLPLLEKIVGDPGPRMLPYAYDDASWVGYRLTEIAPVQPLAKQKPPNSTILLPGWRSCTPTLPSENWSSRPLPWISDRTYPKQKNGRSGG